MVKYQQKMISHTNLKKKEGKLISISKILLEDNVPTNLFSKLASTNLVEFSPQVWIEVLEKPSVEKIAWW
jgi:hypothetical protein